MFERGFITPQSQLLGPSPLKASVCPDGRIGAEPNSELGPSPVLGLLAMG